MLLKVNYFAADEGKGLNCRVFIEAEMEPVMPACEIPHNLFLNNFLHNFLILFNKSLLVFNINLMLFSKMKKLKKCLLKLF